MVQECLWVVRSNRLIAIRLFPSHYLLLVYWYFQAPSLIKLKSKYTLSHITIVSGTMCSSVGTVTSLRVRWPENQGSIPGKENSVFFFERVATTFGVRRSSYSVDDRALSRRSSGRDLILTTHLYPNLKLKMSGAKLLLPLHAFMSRTGKTSLLLPVFVTSGLCPVIK